MHTRNWKVFLKRISASICWPNAIIQINEQQFSDYEKVQVHFFHQSMAYQCTSTEFNSFRTMNSIVELAITKNVNKQLTRMQE